MGVKIMKPRQKELAELALEAATRYARMLYADCMVEGPKRRDIERGIGVLKKLLEG